MSRITRYQAAIILDGKILLIKHKEHESGRAYWLVPGGGIEAGETEHQCVQREVREETNLQVEVKRLLLDEPSLLGDKGEYTRYKTYLCHPLTTQASPGYEPEPEAVEIYAITDVGWFDIYSETDWNTQLRDDPITAPGLRRIRHALEEEKCQQKNDSEVIDS